MSEEGKVHIGSIGGDLSGNVAGGDINIGGSNVVGSNVNIGSTLTNVSQQAGSLPQASPDERAALADLIKQLETELKKLPADKQDEAELVAEYTQELVDEANKEKPKKSRLTITGDGLKAAAKNLLEVAPQIGQIAAKIVANIHSQNRRIVRSL